MTQAGLFDAAAQGPPAIPVNASIPTVESPRLSRQCRLILDRLRAGNATNRELSAISLKYTGRVSDLRAAGYKIEVIGRNHDTGLNVYALKVSR